MHLFLRAASIGVAAWLTCAHALGQTAVDLEPPIAQGSTEVPYPKGGEGDAEVTLELVVEKDGRVSSATVVVGPEPFAEQARAAALTWRFQPATRNHEAVRARISARVAFQRDVEVPEAVPSAPPVATDAAPAPPPVAPEMEVTVVGARRDIGQTTLSKSDVREMPGAFGDAFRAIEALPGVAPILSGVPYFYVRGAPPNNAGYFIDGVRVPLLFHLGIGQSVVHPGLIERVDFFPSAAPARYGGFAGGVLAGHTREPATERHGEASVRLVDAGALLETPFAGGRGSALLAGRYGYPGPILALVTDDMKIGYWDYQARLGFALGPHDTVSAFAFGSHDYLATLSRSGDPAAGRDLIEQFVSNSHRLDLRYDHAFSEGRLRLAVTGGYDSQGASPVYATNHSLGVRAELEQRFEADLQFRAGLDARLEHYRIRLTEQGPREADVPAGASPPPTNLTGGMHADFVWRPAPRVELVPGARFDLYASSRRREAPEAGRSRTLLPAIDPRLSARIALTPTVSWISTFGLAHQYPSLRLGNIPAPILSVPGFPFGDHQLQTAAQLSQGVEVGLPADLTLTATGFYSHWWGLTDLSASCYQLMPGDEPEPGPNQPPAPYVCPNGEPIRGRAYGVELMLRRPFTKRLSGWLSYTLSRATGERHFLTPAGTDTVATVPSDFDRTHVLNAVLGYDLGRRWRIGGRLLLYSGTPYSQRDGSLPIAPYNAYRNPVFYRVDFRLEKRWLVGKSSSIAFVLEGQNITLSKEVSSLGLECEGQMTSRGQTTRCEQSKLGPLTIPSVGVEAFF